MNIVIELVRYASILMIGIILIVWYERKKGWNIQFKISFFFIFCWKSLMFIILISINLIYDLVFYNIYELHFVYPIISVVVSFFINILLGVKIFKYVYNQKIQESIVIVLIIVIIEMILESIFLYSFLIPETISHFDADTV